MVSCENLLAESSELFSSGSESTLKNLKASGRKIYRSGGGIFSNPFKSDSEKMEQLSELLRQYAEHGIPNPKHLPIVASSNKLSHLRASSLSISGILGHHGSVGNGGQSSPGGSSQGSVGGQSSSSLLSTAKTSLSTTDLHHLNHSSAPFTLTTSTPIHNPPCPVISSSSFDASTCDSNYYLEPEWRSLVESADQLHPRIQSQNEAIWELLQTEVFYIRRLKVINDVFISCLLNLQNECLLTEIDAKSMFSNIGEVLEANHYFWMNHLLPMLNYSRETKTPLNPVMLEDGFLQFDQMFRPYIQYCMEHSNCLQYLKEKRKSNVLFKTYILWCENHKDCERLRLMDLLVKPMQRLTKYSLLLKAILKKTDNETHKESLKRMDLCVERFVMGVNAAMYRQQEHERLSAVVSRIESYDAIDCNNDEAEKFLKDYLFLDLMQAMPGCATHKIRHLYLEDTLKLKDAQSNKQDVHCFLFTDVFLVCKPLNKKSSDSKMKVIRQPFITDRLIVRELKDTTGFLIIYLNELNVASTFLLLYTPETRTWVDTIRKAQDDYRSLKYSSEQEYVTYQTQYDEEDVYVPPGFLATSPRSSSRSSLIHSHSGSQDMSDQPAPPGQLSVANNNQLSIQAQPPRAVSFELGDLRNPSLVVEDTDSFARSQSVDNRSPAVTVTSPRPERRAFLLRNNNPKSGSGATNEANGPLSGVTYLSQNSLSVNVPSLLPVQPHPRSGRRSLSNSPNSSPGGSEDSGHGIYVGQANQGSAIQVAVHPPISSPSPPTLPPSPSKRSMGPKVGSARPLPPLPPQSSPPPLPVVPPPPPPPPPSLMSISSRAYPSPMTMSKPPLVKTKNVSYGVASMSYAGDKNQGHVFNVCEPVEDMSSKSQSTSIRVEDCYKTLPEQKISMSENCCNSGHECNDESSKNRNAQQQKRTYRPDRRYHTADSIEHLKKEKDNSIHKRLSWNYGQHHMCVHQQHHCGQLVAHHCCANTGHLLQPRPLGATGGHHNAKCLSTESVCSSSGFSSTGSVPLSVGSTDNNCDHVCFACCSGACSELQRSQFDEEEEDEDARECMFAQNSDRDSALPASPALASSAPVECYHSNSQCSMESTDELPPRSPSRNASCSFPNNTNSDIKIDVSEVRDGISSVQITLTGSAGSNSVTRPSKADLKKMKEFLLSNCNMESSEV